MSLEFTCENKSQNIYTKVDAPQGKFLSQKPTRAKAASLLRFRDQTHTHAHAQTHARTNTHTQTHAYTQSVGLHWTRDRPVAETSI